MKKLEEAKSRFKASAWPGGFQLIFISIVLNPSNRSDLTKEIPIASAKLCKVVDKFDRPRPREGSRYPRYIFSFFPAAYQNAGEYLQKIGDAEGAATAFRVAASLYDGKQPESWQRACGEFRARYQVP